MRKSELIISLGLALSLLSCKDRGVRQDILQKQMPDLFPLEVSARVQSFPFPAVIDVENFFVCEKKLVCESSLDTFAIYCFDLNDFSYIDKCGKRGEGPDEFLAPMIIKSQDKWDNIADGAKSRLYVNGETLDIRPDLPNQIAVLNPHSVGYYCLAGGDRCFKIFDLKQNNVTDSLFLTDISPELGASPFSWSSNGNKIVLSFFKECKLAIFDNNEGLISNGILLNGSKSQDSMVVFGSIDCADDVFFVLNQSNVDFQNNSGESEIWGFTYDGEPVIKIKTGMIINRICYDKSNNRLIIINADDDETINVVNLSEYLES